MRDNWAVGFSQRFTVGVWVGNASGAPMWDVSGTTGAAPIWAAVMSHLHKAQPSHAPKPPAGVVQLAVRNATEAPRQDWFIHGTQQADFALSAEAATAPHATGTTASARITAPANGSIIALDPDIPPKSQRLSFSSDSQPMRRRTSGSQPMRWLMDGKEFAKGTSAQWLPWPGRHVVQLVSGSGEKLDEIRLEVRGAGVVAKR
jgi:penicillin-binding protein 1C